MDITVGGTALEKILKKYRFDIDSLRRCGESESMCACIRCTEKDCAVPCRAVHVSRAMHKQMHMNMSHRPGRLRGTTDL